MCIFTNALDSDQQLFRSLTLIHCPRRKREFLLHVYCKKEIGILEGSENIMCVLIISVYVCS